MTSNSPASPHSLTQTEPVLSEMEIDRLFPDEEPSTLWDWGELLDFSTHDLPITFPFHSDHHQVSTFPPPAVMHPLPENPVTREGSDRVRKRDPRLTCENFLAGRVPCACPEMDAKIAEEEEAERERGKKKARTVRAAPGTVRCQVPGCEVDIRELKGYHKRHRVCLKCANASEVLIHEEIKRYCQQCGKFHILSDFDEGKRSCRRKLERHNNRRRRKSIDSKCSLEQETQDDTLNNTVSCDVEVENDKLCLSDPIAEKDSLVESEDGHVIALCSAPSSHNLQGDSVITFNPSGSESQLNGEKDNSKNTLSTSYFDNKSAYSSTCPTGRISFKLYDWNPAEFPRRLRHQIFQWLSSMPVELEGYIRPGCTILTAFVSMPQIMWDKLLEHHASYLHDFVVAPGSMLSGKGSVLVYINDMRFLILKDRTSVIKVKEEVKAPRIHYVHPTCFEAGKEMEFVACGSNLAQPKFRFLVSFSGKYLENECFLSYPHGKSNEGFACNIEHQLYKINVPYAQSKNLSGPAFIEVENESGFSNFVPILIGDKEVCSEMKKIQHRFEMSLCSKGSSIAANSCEASVLRQTLLSDFISDIAWLVKEPTLDGIKNSLLPLQIQRYNCLLNILISNDSTVILPKVIQSLKNLMDRMKDPSHCTCDVDLTLFQKNVKHAEYILSENIKNQWDSVQKPCFENDMHQIVPTSNQQIDTRSDIQVMTGSPSFDRTENLPLLKRDVIVTVSHKKELPKQSITRVISTNNRPTIFVIAFAVICFGICTILIHPQKASKFVVSIKRCLFDNLRP